MAILLAMLKIFPLVVLVIQSVAAENILKDRYNKYCNDEQFWEPRTRCLGAWEDSENEGGAFGICFHSRDCNMVGVIEPRPTHLNIYMMAGDADYVSIGFAASKWGDTATISCVFKADNSYALEYSLRGPGLNFQAPRNLKYVEDVTYKKEEEVKSCSFKLTNVLKMTNELLETDVTQTSFQVIMQAGKLAEGNKYVRTTTKLAASDELWDFKKDPSYSPEPDAEFIDVETIDSKTSDADYSNEDKHTSDESDESKDDIPSSDEIEISNDDKHSSDESEESRVDEPCIDESDKSNDDKRRDVESKDDDDETVDMNGGEVSTSKSLNPATMSLKLSLDSNQATQNLHISVGLNQFNNKMIPKQSYHTDVDLNIKLGAQEQNRIDKNKIIK